MDLPSEILIEKWNRIIDIMNGRDNEYYSPEDGRAYQEELLDTLAWFSKWKKDHDDDLHTMQRKLTEIENFTV